MKTLIHVYACDPCWVLSNVLLEHHESEHVELNKCHHARIFILHRLELQAGTLWGLCVLQILRDHDIYVRIKFCSAATFLDIFSPFSDSSNFEDILWTALMQRTTLHLYFDYLPPIFLQLQLTLVIPSPK